MLVAVGQENAFPWIERDVGIEFDKWDMPKVDTKTMASTNPKVFFGGDAAFGPKNIIWAVAHGHEAALSIDKFCSGEDIDDRPLPMVDVVSQKMGIHEWSYDNDISADKRYRVPLRDKVVALRDIKAEVELGYRHRACAEGSRALPELRRADRVHVLALHRVRCLRRHLPDGLHHVHARTPTRPICAPGSKAPARNLTQDLYVADGLKTGRVMVKDEDVCLHCGLCAERCPTGAWDMQKYLIDMTHADDRMPSSQPDQQRKRLRRPVRQRQRIRLGERQRAVRARDPAHGRSGRPRNIFPSNIQGLPTWYEVRVTEAGSPRRARRRRPDGRDEPADLGQGRRRDRAGRLSALRLHQADADGRSFATTSTSSACR